MRIVIVAWLILCALPAAAQQPERYTEPTEPIIVTGIRIEDYRARLAACLARDCPVDEDVDATLALAEALMLNGDYDEARHETNASLRRNRDAARAFPEPVSDLHRAHSRLSRHMGFDRAALQSAHGILNALQAGIPQEDHRHFTARFELAHLQMAMGRASAARRELDRLARQARTAGREDVAIIAELRTLWFNQIADPNGPSRSRLIEMSQWTDPTRRLQATGAKVLLARIYRSEGDQQRANALLAEVGRGTSAHRRLLHTPRYQLLRRSPGPIVGADADSILLFGNVRNRVAENYQGKWIDVGFWVLPDGHVADLEVLRTGGDASWADPLLTSIRGRRYSTGDQPTYRLERYTYTAAWETATGTHIRQRSPEARVEYLDLTTGDVPDGPATRVN